MYCARISATTLSYTLSRSLDTNSLNSSGFAVQNGYDIPGGYGLSDFEARHRFVVSATYELPFTGHALARGWQVATIVQAQSGNPVNIVTSNSSLNGVPNTVRPDLIGPIRIIGSVDQWFDPSAFAAVNRFGNLDRNVVIGPSFINTDLSVMKTFKRMQELLGAWHDFVVLADKAMAVSLHHLLSHRDPALQEEVFDLARTTLRRSARELGQFAKVWSAKGQQLAGVIRAAFPLSQAPAGRLVSESQTDRGRLDSGAEAASAASPPDAPSAAS